MSIIDTDNKTSKVGVLYTLQAHPRAQHGHHSEAMGHQKINSIDQWRETTRLLEPSIWNAEVDTIPFFLILENHLLMWKNHLLLLINHF